MAKKQTTKPAGKARKTTSKKGVKGMPATPRATKTRDPRLPAAGTTLTRRYKGRDLRVTVLDEGFRFEGEIYKSLTATALKATGYPAISGPHFWKLDAPAATPPATTAKTATA
jgi:hypothetical protein